MLNTLTTDDRIVNSQLHTARVKRWADTYITKEHSKFSTWRNMPSPVTMPITTNNMQYQLVCVFTSSGACTDSTCQKCKNSYYHIFKFLLCVFISIFKSHCWERTWAIKLPVLSHFWKLQKDDWDWDLSKTIWLNIR